jgi:hypothetical protein
VSDGIKDTAAGTRWSITGEALQGEHAGQRLEPVAEAYVAFRGAWAAFHPSTRLWLGPSGVPLSHPSGGGFLPVERPSPILRAP